MFQGLCVQQVRLGFSPPPSVGFVPQFPHPNHRAALLEDPQQDLFKAGLFGVVLPMQQNSFAGAFIHFPISKGEKSSF